MKLKLLAKKLNPIFKKYPLICVYLFGSQISGKIRQTSDFDFGIYLPSSLTQKQRNRLLSEIQEMIEKKLNAYNKIDIICLNEAQPFLEHQITYYGKIIYSNNESSRAHYEAQAISRWLDWQYHQEKFDKITEKQLGQPVQPFKLYA